MEKAIIIKMDEVDLTNIIRQVIREEIKSLINEIKNHAEDNTLLSRKEAAKMLKILIATLSNYQKHSKIPYLKLGRKVYFKKKEIMKAIELPVKYQRKY